MTPRELIAELAALTKAEKAEVVERLAQEISDSWPGIEKTPAVAGGSACVVRTRIPVWTLEGYRRLVCSQDPDVERQAAAIDAAVRKAGPLGGLLIRVNRPT